MTLLKELINETSDSTPGRGKEMKTIRAALEKAGVRAQRQPSAKKGSMENRGSYADKRKDGYSYKLYLADRPSGEIKDKIRASILSELPGAAVSFGPSNGGKTKSGQVKNYDTSPFIRVSVKNRAAPVSEGELFTKGKQLNEGPPATTRENPLVVVWEGPTSKGYPEQGIIGHMHLTTAQNIHKFTIDDLAEKLWKAGEGKRVKAGKVYLELSEWNKKELKESEAAVSARNPVDVKKLASALPANVEIYRAGDGSIELHNVDKSDADLRKKISKAVNSLGLADLESEYKDNETFIATYAE